jgi:hypothetical protein
LFERFAATQKRESSERRNFSRSYFIMSKKNDNQAQNASGEATRRDFCLGAVGAGVGVAALAVPVCAGAKMALYPLQQEGLSGKEYELTTLDALDKYVPGIRDKVAYVEAATPKTFKDYTDHWGGASFGTKYEGLAVSRALASKVGGLFHAGSVGIIMSGWLGAVNYGVIAANDVDGFLVAGAEN